MQLIITVILKATLLLSLSIILLGICRKGSASLKHWIISMSLIGLLFVPVFIQFLPHLEVEIPYYRDSLSTLEIQKQEKVSEEILATIPQEKFLANTVTNTIGNRNKSKDLKSKQSIANTSISSINIWYSLWIIWLIGCFIGILKLVLGVRTIYQLSQSSHPFPHSFASDKGVTILCSSQIKTPMTWGLGKGIILLPQDAQEWSADTLNTVLIHEWAHIQRKDYWVHLLSLLSACFYWFHPMVWWMKKKQILEREKACDEYVLQSGLSSQFYAQQLIAVAKSLSSPTKVQATYALPMAQVSQLKQRIIAILQFQKEQFQFSKIKQSQWATLFVIFILSLSAFTPIQKSGIVDRFLEELPALLPNTPSLLEVVKPRAINPKVLVLPSDIKVDKPIIDKPVREVIQTLPTRSTSTPLIPLSTNSAPIKLSDLHKISIESNKPAIKGQYGAWTEKGSDFRIATYGNYRTISVFPYLEAEDAESMIIIEQTKGLKKKFCLVITKAPFEGKIVQTYRNGKPNSWSGHYQTDDVVYLWTVNGEWEFLGDRNRDKWMAKKMLNILNKLQSGILKSADEKDFFWNQLVQTQQHIKEKHFVANERLSIEDAQYDWVEPTPPLINWESIPYQATGAFRPVDQWGKVGNTIAINTTSGGCPMKKGTKFGKVFRNMPHSVLKSFNFKLNRNQHKKIEFKLHLYQMSNGEISHRIISAPIQSGAIENSYEGWVRMELNQDKIYAKGDILAVLEVDQKQGRKLIGNCLMLNHTIGLYKSVQRNYPIKEADFFHQNFAFYFTVQQ